MKRRRLSDNMRIQNLERAFKATETQNLQIVELLAQVVKKLHSEEKERSNSSVPESEKEANLEGGEETEDTLSDGYLSEGSTASDSVNPLPPLSFHTKKTDADVLETPNSLSEIVPRDGEFLQDMPLDKTDLGKLFENVGKYAGLEERVASIPRGFAYRLDSGGNQKGKKGKIPDAREYNLSTSLLRLLRLNAAMLDDLEAIYAAFGNQDEAGFVSLINALGEKLLKNFQVVRHELAETTTTRRKIALRSTKPQSLAWLEQYILPMAMCGTEDGKTVLFSDSTLAEIDRLVKADRKDLRAGLVSKSKAYERKTRRFRSGYFPNNRERGGRQRVRRQFRGSNNRSYGRGNHHNQSSQYQQSSSQSYSGNSQGNGGSSFRK